MRCVGVCFLIQQAGTALVLALVTVLSLTLKQGIARLSLPIWYP
mgnify:CR=1 FL=1